MEIDKLVKTQSEYTAKSLSGFWRIAKACMDGKYRKVRFRPCSRHRPSFLQYGIHFELIIRSMQKDATGAIPPSRRPASTCRSMAMEIVQLYISLLDSFFQLSEKPPSRSQGHQDDMAVTPLPVFVPAGTTVLTACHFGEKLVDEVNEGIADLAGVDIGAEAGSSLKGMMQSVRYKMLALISAAWARGRSSALSLSAIFVG